MSTLQTTHIGRHWPKKPLLIQSDLQESQVQMSDDHVKVTGYVKHLLIFPSHPEEVKAGAKPNREEAAAFLSLFLQNFLEPHARWKKLLSRNSAQCFSLPQVTGALSTILDSPKPV